MPLDTPHTTPPLRRERLRFSAIERRLEASRKRLPGYPYEELVLARMVTQLAKRQADLCNSVLRRFDLNYVEFNVLMAIFESDQQALTASALGAATGEKPTNVTRLCDELVKNRLVERSRHIDDRRSVVLRLTPKAERLFEELHPALWDALHATYGGLGKDEIRQLTVLLRRPLAALEG